VLRPRRAAVLGCLCCLPMLGVGDCVVGCACAVVRQCVQGLCGGDSECPLKRALAGRARVVRVCWQGAWVGRASAIFFRTVTLGQG
jgi:hypothetical protein